MSGEIYLSAASRWIEIGLAVSGVLILFFAWRAFMSFHAWGEGAEYEMLGIDAPRPGTERPAPGSRRHEAGTVGAEDRIVRIGFTIALSYLGTTWFGVGSPAMWIMAGPIVYLMITALAGRDPLYRRFGITTQPH